MQKTVQTLASSKLHHWIASLGLMGIGICSLLCSYSLLACSLAPTASEGGVEPALPSVEDFARGAEIIVIGTVIAEEDNATTEVVDVQYYLKGSGPHEIRIAAFDEPCLPTSLGNRKGAKEIFFATGNPIWTLHRVSPLGEWVFGQHYDANDQESIKKILSMTGQGFTKPSSGKAFLLWGIGGMLLVLVVFLFLWKRRLKRIRSYKSQEELSN